MQSRKLNNLNQYNPSVNNPWDSEKIQFVLRRLGFGASLDDISRYLNYTPSETIEDIINSAQSLAATAAPEWSEWDNKQFNASGNNKNFYHTILQKQALSDMTNNGFRERLSLFWSNHFVVEYLDVNQPAYLSKYYKLIQENCLGNFKTFLSKMGLTPAMLMYLNGFQNKKNSPNENYARELYELFTLGEGNGYNQQDIVETSRALTGYNRAKSYLGEIEFNENTFDKGSKTIFGKTGKWGYDDVINILFDEKQDLIADFICKKIYSYFVSPETNT